jgi:hypothetical protein
MSQPFPNNNQQGFAPVLVPPQYPQNMQNGQMIFGQQPFQVIYPGQMVQMPPQQFIPVQPQQIPVQQKLPQMQQVPVQQIYYQPTETFAHHIDTASLIPENHLQTTEERLSARTYQVDISKWIGVGWSLYKQHWAIYSIFTFIYLAVSSVPYVGFVGAIGLAPGMFICGMHVLRPSIGWKSGSLFHGFMLYFPILLIHIIYSLAVAVGLLLLIIPGLYFMIALSFAPLVYIEYYKENIGIMGSFHVSRRLMNKKFCQVLIFFMVLILMNILGGLCFLIGLFVSIPVGSLAVVAAFRDIFGTSEVRGLDTNCVCCC